MGEGGETHCGQSMRDIRFTWFGDTLFHKGGHPNTGKERGKEMNGFGASGGLTRVPKTSFSGNPLDQAINQQNGGGGPLKKL